MRDLRSFTSAAFALCACLAFASSAHADVQLSVRNGRVTLVAKDATLRQILTEWARVGKTKIVNLEKIPGGPLTLELHDVPEGEALDILLRTLSGYIVAPRASASLVADASVYESISVMPTVAAAPTRAAAPPPAPPPFAAPPQVFTQTEVDQGNGQPGVVRPPTFNPFPGQPSPQQGNVSVRPVLPVVRPGAVPPQPNPNDTFQQQPVPTFQPPVPAATPGAAAPIGVSAPGMIAPSPGTSQPGQSAQPQRPPGD